MAGKKPGPSTLAGLSWLAKVGPSPLEAFGVAMGWGQATAYSHAQRLRAEGWAEARRRVLGEGSLVYASRTGVRLSGVEAAVLNRKPTAVSWPHYEACAWTAAWLTARGRGMLGAREMLLRDKWRADLHWYEHGETRKRGHRPDLAGRLPDGPLMPIEVELSDKSPARLRAVIALHAQWIDSGRSPAVMYVCANEQIAGHVSDEGASAGLSVEHGTLRVELLETIRQEAVQACAARSKEWHLTARGVA
jgi:hypothetical protein